MSENLRDKVADHFKANAGKWISMQELAAIAGTGGWRTRVSECRVILGMHLENRTARVQLANGEKITQSHYQYRPAVAREVEANTYQFLLHVGGPE